ncbi:MAG: pseudouridine synthase [Acidobacteriota bacterium]
MAEEKKFEAKVDKALDGERIDKALSTLFSNFSRRLCRKMIEEGAVYINGKRCLKLSKSVSEGDELKIILSEKKIEKKEIDLEVVYDNYGFLAVNKPPFLPSVPTRSNLHSAHSILSKMKKIAIKDIHPVNRLDTPVSGVLLFACEKESIKEIELLKSQNKIDKTYLAWVAGVPSEKEGRIDFPLTSHNGSAFVDVNGKESVTLFKVIKTLKGFSLLELKPLTGRMHQIRVHLKEKGFPIVGDRKYGVEPQKSPRALLHCLKICFSLERQGQIEIEAKIPQDFLSFEKDLED